jgi:hypothetical protein
VNIPAALERELQGYCLAAEHELRVYTLEEVARLTHFSLRFLTVACRGGELIHTRQGQVPWDDPSADPEPARPVQRGWG